MSQPLDAIDRTPEYEQFMANLREFHARHGTTLQPEPVLGGKRLDLLLIWKTVMAAGGYEKVTANRGWKQVGDPFNFPPTCTNSAYILKGVYTRNLLGWEEETVWHRPWVPPKQDEPRHVPSKASSPVPPRTVLIPQQPGTALAPPPTAGPVTPLAYQPKSGSAYAAPVTFANQQQAASGSSMMLPQGAQAQQRGKLSKAEAYYIEGGHKNRILLALKSGLPNEVDWAFNSLVKLSYECPDNFHLDMIPSLLPAIVKYARQFFDVFVAVGSTNAMPNGMLDTAGLPDRNSSEMDVDDIEYNVLNNKSYQEALERVLQVFHVIRNFSFLDSSVRILASNDELKKLLISGLGLPSRSRFMEIKQHCLDVLENISPQILLRSTHEDIYVILSELLYTSDRALILGSVRTLTRLAVNEGNEKVLSNIDINVVQRLYELLLLNDEELLAATLEYFYQYSSLHGNFNTQLIACCPADLVGVLVGFLKAQSGLSLDADPSQKKPTSSSAIPDLTDYEELQEPYRCLGWIKQNFETSSADNFMCLGDIYKIYHARFADEGMKLLGAADLVVVIEIAFRGITKMESPTGEYSEPILNVRLHGIRLTTSEEIASKPKSTANNVPEGTCQWSECQESFPDRTALFGHILNDHVPKYVSEPYKCHWINCDRYSEGTSDRNRVVTHLKTHFADDKAKENGVVKRSKNTYPSSHLSIDPAEVSGIPLTAALVLRNLAREKSNKDQFAPYLQELTVLAVQRPRLTKYIIGML
ncbi:hypothetical protein BZG36_00181 [Bifiguratus adelaidae]|uniref:ARID domain-containing protein n=1 Tax=Bifiguratus adelaidae TaxID=1938954 RepID=A0A261Y8C0_9FUNG|nr:hypothetical protein BZG36_00181 [Bifiguratus adelaidae]